MRKQEMFPNNPQAAIVRVPPVVFEAGIASHTPDGPEQAAEGPHHRLPPQFDNCTIVTDLVGSLNPIALGPATYHETPCPMDGCNRWCSQPEGVQVEVVALGTEDQMAALLADTPNGIPVWYYYY